MLGNNSIGKAYLMWKVVMVSESYHARASRTDARRQGRVHVDDGGGLRAGDAEALELIAEEEAELLQDW